jgi:hypothetical protein
MACRLPLYISGCAVQLCPVDGKITTVDVNLSTVDYLTARLAVLERVDRREAAASDHTTTTTDIVWDRRVQTVPSVGARSWSML